MDNNIYLEIYEFVLQKYPKTLSHYPGIITINIESIPEDKCGLISIIDSVSDDKKIRSCDTINGMLTTANDNIEYIVDIFLKLPRNFIKFLWKFHGNFI